MTNVRTAYRSTNRRLLISCAGVALAAALLAPQKAQADAFNGSFSSSDATRASTGTGTETITVNSGAATINWTNANSDFLPNGNTATFTSSLGDYTVLNTVAPSDTSNPIQLNGTVVSYVSGQLSGASNGGKIWFYSPSGIIIGANAHFDVGGLLLTSLSIANGWTADANGFSASFSKQTGNGGPITVNSTDIKALQQNSYVALVAPRVEQAGDIRVNGSAALVAADQVSMTMNQGLFDIRIDVGTDNANGIVHTGTTTGPAQAGNHRIYMMAVPKNQAMQMLIGGTIGYDATTAGVINGEIYLSAGVIHQDDIPDAENPALGVGLTIGNGDAGILIDNASFNSWASALAMRNVDVQTVAGNVTFASDGVLQSAYGDVSLEADGTDKSILFDGAALLYASPFDFFLNEGDSESRTGGNVSVSAINGGSIEASSMDINVDGKGEDNAGGGTGIGGTGMGGTVSIYADGGTIDVAGDLRATALGIGGDMRNGSATAGGEGYGGTINVSAEYGQISVGGTMTLDASGLGGTISPDFYTGTPTTGTGGLGQGGQVTAYVDGPDGLLETGSAILRANGWGGNGQTGGDAYGGTAEVYADDGVIDLGNNFQIAATGAGGGANFGVAGNGGDGVGGHAYIEARGYPLSDSEVRPAALIKGGNGEVYSDGVGGAGGAGNSDLAGGLGGNGNGGANCDCNNSGGASISAQVGGAALDFDDVTVRSNGTGGAGGAATTSQNGGDGGSGYGGEASVNSFDWYETSLHDGQIAFGTLEIQATGTGGVGGVNTGGGSGGSGGYGLGGSASLEVSVPTTTADLALRAVGFGGWGGTGYNGGDGGNGEGGWSELQVDSGASLSAGAIVNLARGTGGDGGDGTGETGVGGDGGDARGNSSSITVSAGATLTAGNYLGNAGALNGYLIDSDTGQVVVDPETGRPVSVGGNGGLGTAGTGSGGNAFSGNVSAQIDGNATITNNFVATAFAGAGHGSSGGDADAGSSTFTVNGLLDAGGTVQASARAAGGNGGDYGGQSRGGSASLSINGEVDATYVFVAADAGSLDPVLFDGYGALAGGASYSGTAILTVSGGELTADNVYVQTNAVGGNSDSGTGGQAIAGTPCDCEGLAGEGAVFAIYEGGTVSITNELLVESNATGGDGADGGYAHGGHAELSAFGVGTTINVNTAAISASATGGNASGDGGTGGYGEGGTVWLSADAASIGATSSFGLNASAFGGDVSGADSIGGDVKGGSVSVTATNGAMFDGASLLDIDTYGELGQGPAYGTYLGSGDVSISKDETSTIKAMSVQIVTGIFDFAQTANFDATNLYLGVDGDYSVSDYSIAGNLSIAAGGDLTATNLSGDSVFLFAANNLNVGNVTGEQSASFNAYFGTATFTGDVVAPEIEVTSADINVQGNLGEDGVTTLLTLNARSSGDVLIGGVDNPDAGYQLSEEGDLNSAAIVVNAINGNDIVIGDVEIEGSASEEDGTGSVTVNTDGDIRVVGLIDYFGAGTDDVLALNAGNRIEVATDAGGAIAMTDINGDLSGTLELTAHDIWVADGSVLGQLRENSNPTDLAALLATNNGADNQGGYIRAGGIEATMLGSSFLVQNSGTADNFAGVSVGEGGLTIVNNGEDAANTIVYGRQVLLDGTVVSGDDFAENAVTTSGSFNTQSTINGCAIGSCASTPPPPPPPCTTGCEPPPPPPPVEPPPVTPPPPPVTPPPVTPPPVTPPPPPVVNPPPVEPPPVVEPPFVPPEVGGSENILGPIGEMSSPLDLASDDPADDPADNDEDSDDSDDQTSVDATLGLVNTGPVNIDQPVDEPITSGGDGGFGGDGPGL